MAYTVNLFCNHIAFYASAEARTFRQHIDIIFLDIFFINICGANIALFPFFFLIKNDRAKDYMFYIGVLSGLISILYPMEPMAKVNQSAEWLDILRFYFHHTMLWAVPLLMVIFKLHKLSWRRVLYVPTYLLGVMLFIIANQVLQSELGLIPLRNDDFFNINYKNSSMIWGPSGAIGDFLAIFCPDFFKYVPVGEVAARGLYLQFVEVVGRISLHASGPQLAQRDEVRRD